MSVCRVLVAEDGLRREARADAFVEMLKSPFLSLGIVAPTLKADAEPQGVGLCAGEGSPRRMVPEKPQNRASDLPQACLIDRLKVDESSFWKVGREMKVRKSEREE